LERRITQGELAKALDVDISTVSRWLNGKTKPNKIQQYHVEKLLAGIIRVENNHETKK
jgi:transcriptional regulator with XRE-family HTH domain